MAQSTTYPLRFDSPALHDAVRTMAEQRGISMNRFIQEALAVQVGRTSELMMREIEQVMDALRGYPGVWTPEEVRAFASAEVGGPDPAQGQIIESMAQDDPYGIERAFAHRLER